MSKAPAASSPHGVSAGAGAGALTHVPSTQRPDPHCPALLQAPPIGTGVWVGVAVSVLIRVPVGVRVGVAVGVLVIVFVTVGVRVGVLVRVPVLVGV